MNARLEIAGLSRRFGATVAADALDHRFRPGACTAVLGPSGSGKTTILNLIAGLAVPDAGRVLLDGADLTRLPAERRGFGLVFQQYALFPHLNVWENAAFGLRVRGIARAERQRRALAALDLLRVAHLADRSVRRLSGGEQQRVALARALAIAPPVLLLDEPLSALDAQLRDDLRRELRALFAGLGITVILVTHDPDEAMTLGDELLVLRAGRIVQAGTPQELYARPVDAFTARVVGTANLLPGTGVGTGVRTALGTVAGVGAVLEGERQVVLRPEDLTFADAEAVPPGSPGCCGRCTSVLHLGDRLRAQIELDGASLTVDVPTEHPVVPGSMQQVAIRPGRGWILPAPMRP